MAFLAPAIPAITAGISAGSAAGLGGATLGTALATGAVGAGLGGLSSIPGITGGGGKQGPATGGANLLAQGQGQRNTPPQFNFQQTIQTPQTAIGQTARPPDPNDLLLQLLRGRI